MKFLEKDFSLELKEKIIKIEVTLKNSVNRLFGEYKTALAKKGLKLNVDFEIVGDDHFHSEYVSSISVGVMDKDGELIDLHLIKIWECERYFLGIPVSKGIPGSKLVGELLDESVEDIQLELKEYLEEHLS
ncbi:MAG: hypothetical protein LPK00_11910 [Bacillaceae bacterium]|nr:hypothetical protein [Bacillaceae bacterium]